MTSNLMVNIEYPTKVDPKVAKTYYRVNDELKDIISKSGFEDQFINSFLTRMKFIDTLGRNCLKTDNFEQLENTFVLAIKFKKQLNLRITFNFIKDNGKDKFVFLYPFLEKNNNNSGKDSYKKAIKISEKRFNEIISK